MWPLKTLPEKVLLPFNEVAKQLRVVGNYWEHFVSFSRKSRAQETVKDAEAPSVPRAGEPPRSAGFIDRSIEDTPVITGVSIIPSRRAGPPPRLTAFLKRKVWWHLFD